MVLSPPSDFVIHSAQFHNSKCNVEFGFSPRLKASPELAISDTQRQVHGDKQTRRQGALITREG